MTYELKRTYMNNDIFWEFFEAIETNKGYEFFRWKLWGYNDSNFFDNVIPTIKKTITIIGDMGTEKQFEISLTDNTIKEIGND